MKRSTVFLIAALLLGGIAMFANTWSIPAAGRRFAAMFQKAEYANALPKHLLARLAQQESDYDPLAVSSAGAKGLMQIVPKWHPDVDPFNIPEAIDYAGSLLRHHYNRFRSWRKALAAYNAGPTRLQKEVTEHGVNWLAHMPAETQAYVAKISNDVRVS